MDDSIPPDLRERIAQLDTELAEIGTAQPMSLEAEPRPELIYHYTDDNGLRGIIENGTLWCTDPYYLNDPSEIAYGVSIAADILAGTAMSISAAAEIFARDFRRNQTDVQQVAHFFVCSFSIKGNDLEQWRAYANNGRGYAIGFDGRMLETAFSQRDGKPVQEHMTFPVSYDEAKLQDIYRQLIAKIMPLISAEYRFMQIYHTDREPRVKFRSRPNTLLRYREFDWKTIVPEAFKEIVIGPGTEPRIGGRFVHDCLRAYFPLATPHVRLSGIPYRPS